MQKYIIYFILMLNFCMVNTSSAQDVQKTKSIKTERVIKLPAPQKEIGKPLMQALSLRQSSRSFSNKEIPLQELSNLLWAAFGVNRENGKRTAPSARNWQEIDVYLSTADGMYVYNAENHSIMQTVNEDIRNVTGLFEFVKQAPLTLVYIADYSKLEGSTETDEVKLIYTSADAGFIIQNVYLYCASQELATVVYGGINREALAKKMDLRDDQKIILAQCVGYSKE